MQTGAAIRARRIIDVPLNIRVFVRLSLIINGDG